MKPILPEGALAQHIAVLGKTGSGKKRCTRCKTVKSLSAFGVTKRGNRSYPRPHCRACDVDRAAEYRKTAAGVRARVVEHKRRFNRHYKFYKAIKSAISCCCCGESDSCCIDFHHLTKKSHRRAALSTSIRRSVSSIVAELLKCIGVCANCHRKLHAGKIQLPDGVKSISLQEIASAALAAGLDINGRPLQ